MARLQMPPLLRGDFSLKLRKSLIQKRLGAAVGEGEERFAVDRAAAMVRGGDLALPGRNGGNMRLEV
jgi:hypothetical protein